MYSFDGKHKARTQISLGGASKQLERNALLQAAREDRRKRELWRKQNMAVLKIQLWFRGCNVRRNVTNGTRQMFDHIIKHRDKDDVAVAKKACGFVYFFKLPHDIHRLVSICQIMLKLVSSKQFTTLLTSNLSEWLSKVKRLLLLCSKCLHYAAQQNVSIPLRMLEVFTSMKPYDNIEDSAQKLNIVSNICLDLVNRGFFSDVIALLVFRVPNSIEPSSVPPTPFADAIKDLLLRPLLLKGSPNASAIMSSFIVETLSCPMPVQVCFWLLPAVRTSLDLNLLVDVLNNSDEHVHTIWMLYSLLVVYESQAKTLNADRTARFIHVLRMLIVKWHVNKGKESATNHHDDDSSEDEEMEVSMAQNVSEQHDSQCFSYVKRTLFEMINTDVFISPVSTVLNISDGMKTEELTSFIEDVCVIVYHLITELKLQVHKTKLLYFLAYSRTFIRLAWYKTTSLHTQTNTGKHVHVIQLIASGHSITSYDQSRIMPMLGSFASLFRYSLFSIYDSDFYNTHSEAVSLMPFTIAEVIEMSTVLRNTIIGLISFMYPDVRTPMSVHDQDWYVVCQMVTQVVKQLYTRDCRHRYCGEGHWLSTRATLNHEAVQISSFLVDDEDELDDATVNNQPRMSTMNLRQLAILKYVPFAIPFLQRVLIFQRIIREDKKSNQNIDYHFIAGTDLNISINRKYLYQDAYDQLASENCSNIKKLIRVQMKNVQGLDEAGIDGGGVFREFMSQLIKTAYDPSYAFFKSTSQQLLYPNPEIGVIQPDYEKHMRFLGRILGKVIYESMMVELPLADFFLCKLLNRHGSDVDIHHLESLDPELYKNLLELKNYHGDADDLSLNFTTVQSGYGDTRVVELKEGGKDICVDDNNKIEYIHLMADYKLNKQIRSHCNAFRAGLSEVINIEWLQMFSHNELQVLVSGARVPIDIEDLKKNTNYSGSFDPAESYILEFWLIVESLTDKQKQDFLKFVTSCSRPPLLGFSELYPKFCIHFGGDEDRLPTASTCMNFLKLPRYKSIDLLKRRLVYAIEADAGFELS